MVLSPVAKYRHPENFQSLQRMNNHANIELVECFNHSEVSRARQVVASSGYRRLMQLADEKNVPDFVLWWDADMVMHDEQSFLRHIEAVNDTGLNISGRYPMRQKQRLAATQDKLRNSMTMHGWELEPVLSGMGCLLMMSNVFRDQVLSSPLSKPADGLHQYLITCPQIIKADEPEVGWVMLSEDFVYCRHLEKYGGVWYAKRQGEKGVEHIDYAHMVERPMASLPSDHLHAD